MHNKCNFDRLLCLVNLFIQLCVVFVLILLLKDENSIHCRTFFIIILQLGTEYVTQCYRYLLSVSDVLGLIPSIQSTKQTNNHSSKIL